MSIVGSVARHPWAALGAGVALWWMWPGAEQAPPARRAQAAVTGAGFAAFDGDRRIVELDDGDGRRRKAIELGAARTEATLVGAGGGLLLVWRDGKKIAVGAVEDNGDVEVVQQFGNRVASMCAGPASNDRRFGVAWTEASGGVWFVHGPTRRQGGAEELEAVQAIAPGDGDARPAARDYCAIASAEDNLALLVTEGSRATLTLCGRSCAGSKRVALPRRRAILGFGCTAAACAVATLGDGGPQLTWVSAPQGRVAWTKPLPGATRETRVALAGVGARIAVAYATPNEPVVVTAAADGTIATAWQGPGDEVPSLVASGDRVLVARHTGGELAGAIVRAP